MMNYDKAYQVIQQCYAEANILSKERKNTLDQYPVYPAGHIFDMDKSVRWNQDEVQRRQNARKQAQKEYEEKERDIWSKAENAIKDYLSSEFGLPPKVVNAVFTKASEEGHPGGFFEILSEANDYGSFAEDVISLSKKEEQS